MAKLKLTKNELKKQKDALKRFRRYLPTLLLKKQHLQLEIAKIHHQIEDVDSEIASLLTKVKEWAGVFAEDIKIGELIALKEVVTSEGNIAGVDIPVFERIEFKEEAYDAVRYPLWAAFGIRAVKDMITLKERRLILGKQLAAIREELRVTTQRVNLFEKV
ncbi:MAG: V-type ATP synthase subunit D, partial [Candidatus Omnitrophota bacterium]